ncbi:MAG: hypothetical protein K2Y39_27900 [Candidatus Obscuribacterales bacterium]|nr:hypothetical protein [Candidatus Obscuribacterales bacterium]
MTVSFGKHFVLHFMPWLLVIGSSCQLSLASPAPTKVETGKATDKANAGAAAKSASRAVRDKHPRESIEKDLMSISDTDQRRNSKKSDHRGRHHGEMPSFRNVKHLESLSAVQSAKINHILIEYKKVMAPLASRFRASREAQAETDADTSEHTGKGRGDKELRRQMRRVKLDAWEKIQKILTPAQKEELGKMRRDDRGPRKRNNPETQPSLHDSGRSFSK